MAEALNAVGAKHPALSALLLSVDTDKGKVSAREDAPSPPSPPPTHPSQCLLCYGLGTLTIAHT
jgi:hypothetical protein